MSAIPETGGRENVDRAGSPSSTLSFFPFSDILDLGRDGLCVIVGGILRHVNTSLVEMLETTAAAMLGRPFLDFVDPAHAAALDELYRRHVGGTRDIGLVESMLVRADGTKVPVEIDGGVIEIGEERAEVVVLRDLRDDEARTTALLESERRYRVLVEHSRDLIGILDGGRLQYVNRAGRRMLATTNAAGDHVDFVERIHPGDRPSWRSAIESAATRDEIADLEIRLPGKNRRDLYFDVSLIPMVLAGRHVLQLVARDVTERRKVREAVVRKDRLLREMIRAAKDAVVMIDADGLIQIFNPAAEKMFGWGAAQAIGKPVTMLLPPAIRRRHERAVRDFFRDGGGHGLMNATSELHTRTVDGRDIDIELSLSSGFVGGAGFVMALVRDVTERKRVVRALEESEERFRALFEHVQDVVLLHKIDRNGFPGRILEVNEATCRLLGYSRDELLRISPLDIHAKPAGGAAKMREVMDELRDRQTAIFERDQIAKDGRRVPVEICASRFEMNGRATVLWVARDITERKKIETIMRRTQSDLEDKIHERTAELRRAYRFLEEQYQQRLQVEQELTESERMLSTLMGNLPGMAYRCRPESPWTMEFVSEGCVDLTGFAAEDLTSRTPYVRLIHPEDFVEIRRIVASALLEKKTFRFVYRIQTSSGAEKWVWEQGRPILDSIGRISSVEGFVTDITERKRAEEQLRLLATRDHLTGLFNRRHFWELLVKRVDESRIDSRRLSVGIADLDGFKQINDVFGHRAGDDVLKNFGEIVRRELRPMDFACRYGGDEFCLVFPDSGARQAVVCAERIRRRFGQEQVVVGVEQQHHASVSIGIVELASHHNTAQDLVDHADRVLYIAKQAGKNRTIDGHDFPEAHVPMLPARRDTPNS
ncbi:MAG: PAS domain S-box protein [Deltaproteobacteria bacterium]|nr:PAS domain S-box protein [Deltaproteobacteria bacterium]